MVQYCALITVYILSESLTSSRGAGSLCVDSANPQRRRRNTKATISRSVRTAKEVFGVPHRYSKCPYDYEIKDGHLFIEGEDYGEAEKAFELGEKLIAFTRVLHEVATA